MNKQEFIPGIAVKQKIGVGGMATVFLAEEIKTGREIALKVLHPKLTKNQVALKRFIREAKLLCSFKHNNIVRGLASGKTKGIYFLIMEFVDGESIGEILDRMKSLPENLAFEIIMQLADAMSYMQQKGIVHRDIKPDNIILTPDGIVKLCDLGLAKPISSHTTSSDPVETTAGTAQYMSPEQAMGDAELDIRSDIYSLGVTLYQMVIGKLPFNGGTNMDILASHVENELSGSVLKSGKISQYTHYFIEKMMAKDKNIRYQTPGEIVNEISSQLEAIKQMNFDAESIRDELLQNLQGKTQIEDESNQNPPRNIYKRNKKKGNKK